MECLQVHVQYIAASFLLIYCPNHQPTMSTPLRTTVDGTGNGTEPTEVHAGETKTTDAVETEDEDLYFEGATIVIENGSTHIKAGFAEQPDPRTIFPTVQGENKYPQLSPIFTGGTFKPVGDDAIKYRGMCRLTFPIEKGVVTDWTTMEEIWHHTFFRELRVDPADHAVLLTEAPLNPLTNREKMIRIMFDSFNIPCLCVTTSAVLSMYATQATTGMVLESGESSSHCVPIYEGYCLPHAVLCIGFGGRQVTEYLSRLLGFNFRVTSEARLVEDIKKTMCYVSVIKSEDEMEKYTQGYTPTYEGSGDRYVTLNNGVAFRAPELLFNPDQGRAELMFEPDGNGSAPLCLNAQGMHQTLYDSILKCDPKLHKQLFQHIVLSGGNVCFRGLDERLKLELKTLLRPIKTARCVALLMGRHIRLGVQSELNKVPIFLIRNILCFDEVYQINVTGGRGLSEYRGWVGGSKFAAGDFPRTKGWMRNSRLSEK